MTTLTRTSIVALVVTAFAGLNLCWGAESRVVYTARPYQLSVEDKLRSAACSNDLQEMSRLLSQGADINSADFDGWTPLIWAVSQDRTEAVRLLLDRGADVNYRSRRGQSPLMVATMNGYTDTMEILLEKGASRDVVNQRGWTPLMEASARGHAEAANLLVGRGADPNFKGKRGVNALRLASFYEQSETAEVLMAKGATPDRETHNRLVNLGISDPHARETEQMTLVQYSKSSERRGITRTGQQTVDSSWLPRYVLEALGQNGTGGLAVDQRRPTKYVAPQGYGKTLVKAELFDPAQSLEQTFRASARSGRNNKQAEAEGLLRQGLEIWNRLRTEYPEVAKRLQEAAGSR